MVLKPAAPFHYIIPNAPVKLALEHIVMLIIDRQELELVSVRFRQLDDVLRVRGEKDGGVAIPW
jgi:hypothetical protein